MQKKLAIIAPIFSLMTGGLVSSALADASLPWLQPKAIAMQQGSVVPTAKFFPINPTAHMRPPAAVFYAAPSVRTEAPQAKIEGHATMNEEQARQILSIYPN